MPVTFIFTTPSKPAVRPNKPLISHEPEALSPRVKEVECEAYHSSPLVPWLWMYGAIPLPWMSSWIMFNYAVRYTFIIWCLIKQQKIFTLHKTLTLKIRIFAVTHFKETKRNNIWIETSAVTLCNKIFSGSQSYQFRTKVQCFRCPLHLHEGGLMMQSVTVSEIDSCYKVAQMVTHKYFIIVTNVTNIYEYNKY